MYMTTVENYSNRQLFTPRDGVGVIVGLASVSIHSVPLVPPLSPIH